MKRTAKILLSMTFTCSFALTACGGIGTSPESASAPNISEEAPADSIAVREQPGYASEDGHADTADDADGNGLAADDAGGKGLTADDAGGNGLAADDAGGNGLTADDTDETKRIDADTASDTDVDGYAGTAPGAEAAPGVSLDAVMDEFRTEIDLSGTLSFSSQTAFGEAIDSSVFSGYDLTMINIWGTLCKPCIAEMQDLQKLYEDMADQGVNILGFVANYQEDRVEKAQAILTAKGVTYSNVVFDDEVSGAITAQIPGFPTTIFVDSQGNVIGEQISGTRSYDEYKDLIAERLEECASWQE